MTTKKQLNFQEIFEEHPIKACLGCFIAGITLSCSVLIFLYNNKIDNIKGRYENKIDFIQIAHKQDLEIKTLKVRLENEPYTIKVDPNSDLGKSIQNLLTSKKDEK